MNNDLIQCLMQGVFLLFILMLLFVFYCIYILVFPEVRACCLLYMEWSVQVHLITLSPKYILYQNSKLNKVFEMVF